VGQYQKSKTNLDFTEARDSEWQWHQLGHMQVCTSIQTDNHASTPPLSFLQAGCPSCRPTNSIKALTRLDYINTYSHCDGKQVIHIINFSVVTVTNNFLFNSGWRFWLWPLSRKIKIINEDLLQLTLTSCHSTNQQ